MTDKAFWTVFIIWAFGVLLSLATTAAVIYIVIHFVAKFW